MARKTFKDAKGNDWVPRVDGDVVFLYESLTGINIFKEIGKGELTGIVPGVKEVMILLWLSVEDQAQQRQIGERPFRKLIHGEAMEQATEALGEAVCDFFPKLRPILAAISEEARKRGGALSGVMGTSSEQQPSQA